MGYKVVQTDLFQQDLEGVIRYIALALDNKSAATALLDAMDQCFDDLGRTPLMYEVCRDLHLRELGYRRAVIRSYIMVYKVDDAARQVTVLRLFHGKQDYENLI